MRCAAASFVFLGQRCAQERPSRAARSGDSPSPSPLSLFPTPRTSAASARTTGGSGHHVLFPAPRPPWRLTGSRKATGRRLLRRPGCCRVHRGPEHVPDVLPERTAADLRHRRLTGEQAAVDTDFAPPAAVCPAARCRHLAARRHRRARTTTPCPGRWWCPCCSRASSPPRRPGGPLGCRARRRGPQSPGATRADGWAPGGGPSLAGAVAAARAWGVAAAAPPSRPSGWPRPR
mmetsp:Transcript_60903/g.175475  ORF Transcript_60903/g.175475 Transcript_60903/m.175475 type:complete len:233 (-) Transcript_60903:405-1103(-)